MPEVEAGAQETGPPPAVARVVMPSPIGQLGLELTAQAVTRVRIDPPAAERRAFTPLHKLDKIDGADFLEEVCGRFAEYFAGARRKLDVDFDLTACGLEPFARRVLRETAKIPYGKTRTYRMVAEGAGRPEAYRQVLAVLTENPLPIVVPCHRVVTNRSGVGSYVGGWRKKVWLLKMEGQGLGAD
ncbi:MAG: methylated-DNA--[protein]-cysteine S-methyltransferase [Thermoanaerobaculia bacterium]